MVFAGPSPLPFVASPVPVAWPTWQPLMRRLVRDIPHRLKCGLPSSRNHRRDPTEIGSSASPSVDLA